jgi:hypothetical protein
MYSLYKTQSGHFPIKPFRSTPDQFIRIYYQYEVQLTKKLILPDPGSGSGWVSESGPVGNIQVS